MLRSSRSRVVLLVLLLLLATVPSLQAAGPSRNRSSAAPGWELLARVWSFLTSSAADNGCEFDPDGRHCLPRPATSAAGDNGCEVDPSGRCHN